jgi:pilus assembly protein CpaB
LNKGKGSRGSVLFLVLTVFFAVLAGIVFVNYTTDFNESVTVPLAAIDIAPYQQITSTMIKTAEIPRLSLPKDALTKVDDILGRYTNATILAGETIRNARLASVSGQDSVLAAKLTALGKPDLRAFALPWESDTAVGGELVPGDRVDIIASVRMESQKGTVGFGKIVGRNVLVLDLVKPTQGKASLIVALTPKEIEDIAFALTSGTIRFALNPYDTDEQAAVTIGVTGEDWLIRHGFGGEPGGSR